MPRGIPNKPKAAPIDVSVITPQTAAAIEIKIPVADYPPELQTICKAKVAQLGLGVDLLGSQLSLQSKRGNQLNLTLLGALAVSGKNGRVILIPWTNIRGVEI